MKNPNTPTEIIGAISLGTIAVCIAWAAASGRGREAALTVAILVAILLYWLPSIVAFHRQHRNLLGIALVNFFFGWSLIGWVVSLVWAVRAEKA